MRAAAAERAEFETVNQPDQTRDPEPSNRPQKGTAPEERRSATSASRPGGAAVAAREAQAGGGCHVRMTRPLKRPMRVALTDHLTGVQSVRESSPAECSWPSRRILLELRLRPRRCYLCRRVHWARRCTPRPDQVSSLSSAMGLTTILTTIWVVHRNTHKRKILISKENWTSEDVGGHAADV